LKTLVVEDKLTDYNNILKCLNKLEGKFDVLHANNTSQAFELLHEGEFELAIIDIDLGKDPLNRSGIDVLSEIDKNHPVTKSIVTTVWDNEYNKALSMQYGARGIVPKIFLSDLLHIVVTGIMSPTSTQPNYSKLGDAFVRHVKGLSLEDRIAAVVDIMHSLNLSTRQLKGFRAVKVKVEAQDRASVIKFNRLIDYFMEACCWANRNLDPKIKSISTADRLFGSVIAKEYEGRLSNTQAYLALGVVIEERNKSAEENIEDIKFQKKLVYSKYLMTVDIGKGRVNLKTEPKGYGRTELIISPDTDLSQLDSFSKPTKGELVYLQGNSFELTLIRKIG